MKNILAILFLTLFITSCSNKSAEMNKFESASVVNENEIVPMTREQNMVPPSSPASLENTEVIKKKIIKDGRLGIEVLDLKKSKYLVDSLVKKHKGYYANESLNNYDLAISYNLTIRIPSINFEKIIAELEDGGDEITHKEIEARDVTDQFIDLESRLANKRNYLKRYNDLLKQARNIKEILEIEEKIRAIEEEIESTTGRLKYLGDLVDYSTLTIDISKKDYKYTVEKRDMFSKRLKHALSKGWFGLIDFIIFAIKIWPFWIIATLIIYVWRKRRKKRKSMKIEKA